MTVDLVGVTMGLILAAACVLAQDNETVNRRLISIKIDANFNEASLKDVVDYIRDLAGVNIIIEKDVLDKNVSVSIQAKGISVRTLLNLVCKANELGTLVQEGILVITTREKAVGDVRLEIYDIMDITAPLKHFPGAEIRFGEDGIQFDPPAPEEQGVDMGDALVEIVKTFTGAKAWDDNPKAGMSYQRGLLIIKQTPEVHRKIQKILLQLRSLQ